MRDRRFPPCPSAPRRAAPRGETARERAGAFSFTVFRSKMRFLRRISLSLASFARLSLYRANEDKPLKCVARIGRRERRRRRRRKRSNTRARLRRSCANTRAHSHAPTPFSRFGRSGQTYESHLASRTRRERRAIRNAFSRRRQFLCFNTINALRCSAITVDPSTNVD